MNEFERTQLDLELILPYVNFLKEKINSERRKERRREQGVVYKMPLDKKVPKI